MPASDLITVAELKTDLGITSNNKDSDLQALVTRVTSIIESFLGRSIVTTGTLVEYHTMQVEGRPIYRPTELRTRAWPILAVASVYEDITWPRTYGAPSLLVAGTDYQVVKPKALIRRISAGFGPVFWASGLRPIKVTYTAGYNDTAAVPGVIKDVALKLGALMYRETQHQEQGRSSETNAMGTYQRFGPAMLTSLMKEQLTPERESSVHVTGEWDS